MRKTFLYCAVASTLAALLLSIPVTAAWAQGTPPQDTAAPPPQQVPPWVTQGQAEIARQAFADQSPWFQGMAQNPVWQLADPSVRAEIGLSAEQEAAIGDLRAKAEEMRRSTMEQMRVLFAPPENASEMTDEERQALFRERIQAAADLVRGLHPAVENLVSEAASTLTPEQLERLKTVREERTLFQRAGGGLWLLTTKKAKEDLKLSDEQFSKIRKLVEEAAGKINTLSKDMRDSVQALPSEQRAAAERSGRETLRRESAEITAKARDAIFALLSSEQRVGAEKILAEGRSGIAGMRNLDRRARPTSPAAPGAPASAPAPVAPAAPATPATPAAPAPATPGAS